MGWPEAFAAVGIPAVSLFFFYKLIKELSK